VERPPAHRSPRPATSHPIRSELTSQEPPASETLVVLTSTYPFGDRLESFLAAELDVLRQEFAQVVVLPSRREAATRRLPEGVRCETFLAEPGLSRVLHGIARSPGRAASLYARGVCKEGFPGAYVSHPIHFGGAVAAHLRKYRLLREFVARESLQDAIYYDYWLLNSTVALGLLRRDGVVHRAVARAHGFDLYDERAEFGAIPYRSLIVESLDRVFPISAYGLSYLAERYPEARGKLQLSRLGVEPQSVVEVRSRAAVPLVVSCANLIPLKRVHLIPDVLAAIATPLRWVHFGDGSERAAVEAAAARLPERVRWELRGHVEHETVIEFYRRNAVDLFLSLSSSEGLPVSIMEAISFGVPVLATDVGGVPEIVNSLTGRLVDVDDSAADVARFAQDLLGDGRPPTKQIMAFFEENFDAERNFREFAALLRAV
jgi:glycosyltransferase involved in cell wall biosynthesis